MMEANSLDFVSDDQRFGVRLERKELVSLLQICREARNIEIGGIIVGEYDQEHKYALVRAISDAPIDSLKNTNWFLRGIKGLQEMLNFFWQKEHYYYIGEWHFHPNSSAQVSSVDIEQMQEISLSKDFNCPEPILIIIGGNPDRKWEVSVYVFPCNKDWIKMKSFNLELPTTGLSSLIARYDR